MYKYGLLGKHLGHSYSKIIHELYFENINVNGSYDIIEKQEDEIIEVIEKLKSNELYGINVTIPYKLNVMKYLDVISDEAKKIGAVNTILNRDGILEGHNTDYYGFIKTLELNNINIENKNVLVLGTGGASRAIYNALVDKNAKIILLASVLENDPFEIKREDKIIKYSDISKLENIELIVNCTPVGMYPNVDAMPLKEDQLIKTNALVDIIYNPEETMLMNYYKSKNVKVINGLPMLILQALKSEEIWNGKEVKEEIYNTIYNKLKEEIYR